jgi:hypothetical protein
MIPYEETTNVIKLDIDNVGKYSEEKVKELLKKYGYEIDGIEYKPSKSLGMHVFIHLKQPISIDLIPFFEAMLGSDIIRSCLIQWRINHNAYLDIFFNSVGVVNDKIPIWRGVNDVVKFMRCRCPELLEKLEFELGDPQKVYAFISDALN